MSKLCGLLFSIVSFFMVHGMGSDASSGLLRKMSHQTTFHKIASEPLFNKEEAETETDFVLDRQALNVLSHDLRAPVQAAQGLLSGVLETNAHLTEILKPEDMEALFSIRQLLTRVTLLAENTLALSRAGAGKLHIEKKEFEIDHMAHELQQTFGHEAVRKGIDFNICVNPLLQRKRIYTDEAKLMQAVSNMISNALKFTHQGSVQVMFDPDEIKMEDDQHMQILYDQVRVTVCDTGIGIPQRDIMRIGSPFFRAENAIGVAGTGLGFSIIKKMVSLLGGELSISSKEGEGTILSFSFTIVGEEKDKKNDPVVSPSSSAQLLNDQTILVVDDNALNLHIAQRLLERQGACVVTAKSPEEAYKSLQENQKITLVLMDWIMGCTDGVTATKYIRNELGFSKEQLPILGLSASLEQMRQKACSCGMNGCIEKSYASLCGQIVQFLQGWKKTKDKD